MATSTQIKASIDINITNKTQPQSINNTTVGADIKSVVDYVDQEALLKENLTNKSIDVEIDGESDTKYPSVKAVKTYVDDNMSGTTVYKVLKTTITNAEVLDIFSTPKTIVPAIAGKIIIPTHIIIVINFNTTQYSDPGGAWKVRFGSTNTSIATPTNFLASATYNQEVLQTLFYSGFISSSGFTNSPILLTTSGNNPTGGDSGLTVYVSYTEITL